MKKIVVIYLGRRGAGPEYAFEMAKAMSEKAQVMCVISRYASNISKWKELEGQSHSLSLKVVATYNSLPGFLIKSLDILKFRGLINSINSFDPDVIYSPMNHFWEKMIVPYCKCKQTIQTVHDPALHEGENGWKYRLLKKIFSYQSSKYVILSKTFKDSMQESGISEDNIIVIPHAVFKGYNSRPLFEDYQQYNRFLFFGRIIKYKGIEVLLNSMNEIIRRHPQATLVIAGNGDISPYKALFEKLKNNLELHIKWIEDNDVESYFNDIDFVVLPYTHASQSGVIPLAYAFGKPVIASKIGGLPEQVDENVTGLLVNPGNEVQLTDNICKLLSSSEDLQRMKKACYLYAKNNTWEVSADLVLNSFN